MTTDTYSPTYSKPFAIYDHATQSLKMFEDTLLWDSTQFLETLPASGMMRNGMLFEHQKSERHTKGQGSSSLPTPTSNEPGFKVQPVDKGGNPTNNPNERWYHPETGRLMQKGITQAARMLPTPVARDYKGDSGYRDNVSAQIKLNWAQFEPAIRQWETVLGREAPQPLIEDQKLNPEFTEWMMGLPKGWITNVDISWTQKIKACGNGVVPQQAKLALTRLVK